MYCVYVKCYGVYTVNVSLDEVVLFLCLYLRFDSVLSFKGSADQKCQRKKTFCSIGKHTRFSETGGDNTQPLISTSLYKVQPIKWVY